MRTIREIQNIVTRVDLEFCRIFNAKLEYQIHQTADDEFTLFVFWKKGKLALAILDNMSEKDAVVFLLKAIAANMKRVLDVDRLSHLNAEEVALNGKKIRKDVNKPTARKPVEESESAVFDGEEEATPNDT